MRFVNAEQAEEGTPQHSFQPAAMVQERGGETGQTRPYSSSNSNKQASEAGGPQPSTARPCRYQGEHAREYLQCAREKNPSEAEFAHLEL